MKNENIKVETFYTHTDDGRAFIPMANPMAPALGENDGATINKLAKSVASELHANGISVRVGGDGFCEYDIVSRFDYGFYSPFGDESYIAIPLAYEFARGQHQAPTGKLVACFPNDWREQYERSGFIPKRYVVVKGAL